jgi:lipopolysaccharide transport system ATP-binding protein
VSHDMGTVRDICNRGICMTKGVVVFDGDNLEAINKYLTFTSQENTKIDITDKNSQTILHDKISEYNIIDPIWNISKDDKNKKASILTVGFYDKCDNSCRTINIGDAANIKTIYKINTDDKVHVTIVLKNKYNQVLTAIGSYNLNTKIPETEKNNKILSDIKIKFFIEAGEYTFQVVLGQPTLNGEAGLVIDETDWLGPITIIWDYQKDVPPFYGMVGLPTESTMVLI